MRNVIRVCVVALTVVSLAIGVSALAKKPGGGDECPTPKRGWLCPTYYAPVECGPNNCWYSNQCFASLAGWSASDCEPVGPGPIPLP